MAAMIFFDINSIDKLNLELRNQRAQKCTPRDMPFGKKKEFSAGNCLMPECLGCSSSHDVAQSSSWRPTCHWHPWHTSYSVINTSSIKTIWLIFYLNILFIIGTNGRSKKPHRGSVGKDCVAFKTSFQSRDSGYLVCHGTIVWVIIGALCSDTLDGRQYQPPRGKFWHRNIPTRSKHAITILVNWYFFFLDEVRSN